MSERKARLGRIFPFPTDTREGTGRKFIHSNGVVGPFVVAYESSSSEASLHDRLQTRAVHYKLCKLNLTLCTQKNNQFRTIYLEYIPFLVLVKNVEKLNRTYHNSHILNLVRNNKREFIYKLNSTL